MSEFGSGEQNQPPVIPSEMHDIPADMLAPATSTYRRGEKVEDTPKVIHEHNHNHTGTVTHKESHKVRNSLIAAGAVIAFVMIEGNHDGLSTAPGIARIYGGVDHATEKWTKVNFDCSDHVSEIVPVQGIQHNPLVGGLTSGGLEFNKGLYGDFDDCTQMNGVATIGTTKKDGKVKSVTIKFASQDFGIMQPRIDMLNPDNRAPLRVGDSVETINEKVAACAKPGADCDDTGESIDWPKIYQGKAFGFFGPKVTIPGPKIAINPDQKVRLGMVADQTAQLAISLDGTDIQRWDAAVESIEDGVVQNYKDLYEGTDVKITVDRAVLPTETVVIGQRMAAIKEDLVGLFESADFQAGPNNQGTVLNVKAPQNTELSVIMSDVAPTPQTLAALNSDLAKYNIGTTVATSNESVGDSTS